MAQRRRRHFSLKSATLPAQRRLLPVCVQDGAGLPRVTFAAGCLFWW